MSNEPVTVPETDEQRAERLRAENPLLSLWRAMSGAAVEAMERRAEDERTAADARHSAGNGEEEAR